MFKTLKYYWTGKFGSFECIKCGQELGMGTVRCPYCDHKQFDFSGEKITWNIIEPDDPFAIDGIGDPDLISAQKAYGEPVPTDWQIALEYIRYKRGDRKVFNPTWRDR